jgi:hypothetical protein
MMTKRSLLSPKRRQQQHAIIFSQTRFIQHLNSIHHGKTPSNGPLKAPAKKATGGKKNKKRRVLFLLHLQG